jgi:glycerol-3-phosphate dehydrogenase
MLLYGTSSRAAAWSRLSEPWDLIIVGGGITGASLLREAVRVGLRVLLVEQNDFASGTSSRSSKLVHGGLRYLENLQFKVTWQSVTERDELLKQGRGLVRSLPFIFTTYRHDRFPPWMMGIALTIYSWMGKRLIAYRKLQTTEVSKLIPGLSLRNLMGGFRYRDAQTDDARLVLRFLREGTASGQAVALNYARVEGLLYDERGTVSGVRVRDRETGDSYQARAAAVVNATGVWADRLRIAVGGREAIRPLRGSHLIFPQYRFPIYQAVTFPHPDDGRPVFVFPWEGVTLIGTTDIDHESDLDEEPAIAPEELHYLLRAVEVHFPDLRLTAADVLATFAGVRPVISHGKAKDPSKESREHMFWNENGLLTVTGGKLTTCRHIAVDTLRLLRSRLPRMQEVAHKDLCALDPVPPIDEPPRGISRLEGQRLAARYGPAILEFADQCPPEERRCLDELPIHWLELRWAARHEAVCHLDDLLLRRVRLGLLASEGGAKFLSQLRYIVRPELGWSEERWQQEVAAYLARWRAHYSLPTNRPHAARLAE